MTWPNLISIFRIVLIVPLTYLLLHAADDTHRRWAILIGFVMGVSDFFDGWLARRLQQFSVWGERLDPIGDKLLVTAGTVILAIPACAVVGPDGHPFVIPLEVVGAIIGKDVFVLAGALIIVSRIGLTRFPARWWGKASTVAQLIMLGLVLSYPEWAGWGPWTRETLVWLCRLSGAFAVAAALDYAVFGVRLLTGDAPRAEPAAPPARSEPVGP